MLNPNETQLEILELAEKLSIINGKLTNCYSLKDYVLKYMFKGNISDVTPIGLIPILNNIVGTKVLKRVKTAQNYDCTAECPGHMKYMRSLNLILDKIPYTY